MTVLQGGDNRAELIGPRQLKGRKELVDTYRIRWNAIPRASAGTAPAE
jgi:hypothetical protein